jgi:ClpX C4-type zinc finger
VGELARSVAAKARDWVGYPKLSCSFCGRAESRVSRLVAGKSAHICDSCVAECVAVLDQYGGFDMPGPTQAH